MLSQNRSFWTDVDPDPAIKHSMTYSSTMRTDNTRTRPNVQAGSSYASKAGSHRMASSTKEPQSLCRVPTSTTKGASLSTRGTFQSRKTLHRGKHSSTSTKKRPMTKTNGANSKPMGSSRQLVNSEYGNDGHSTTANTRAPYPTTNLTTSQHKVSNRKLLGLRERSLESTTLTGTKHIMSHKEIKNTIKRNPEIDTRGPYGCDKSSTNGSGAQAIDPHMSSYKSERNTSQSRRKKTIAKSEAGVHTSVLGTLDPMHDTRLTRTYHPSTDASLRRAAGSTIRTSNK